MCSARIILLTVLLSVASFAGAQQPPATSGVSSSPSPRPRIGLVLSGGGARGAAHIGVLKLLDQLHVPIDAIAGTSMGAVVGGLYASGMSGEQVERAMASVDWQAAFRDRPPRDELDYRRKREERRYLINLPLGLEGRKLVIPKGLVQTEKFIETLRTLTTPVAGTTDFDHLPTRFRAVATDLENGNAVVLADGDLTTAMRASMSVPGVFAPVDYHGRILVDGGLSDYLPIDVARAMGVDVLIVVDAGNPLQPRKNLTSLPGITNQMLAILLRRNIESQLATLGPHDTVISLRLGDFSSYDFADTLKIVNAGESAAQEMEPRLATLAVSDADYQQYLARRGALRRPPPQIEFVHVDAESAPYRGPIEDLFNSSIGHRLDPQTVDQQMQQLYGRGYLETLDYQVVQDEAGDSGLDFSARRNSWGPDYVRLGVLLQDDFRGDTTFNAAGRLDITELNSLGAESVWDAQVGSAPMLSTELYLPLSNVERYFIAPHTLIEAHDVPQIEGGRDVGEYHVGSFDYGLDLGRELSNWGEVRFGVINVEGNTHLSVGTFNVPASDFHVNEFFGRLGYDQLDSPSFPHAGQAFTIQASVEGRDGGGAPVTDLFSLDWRGAHSWAKNSVVLWLSAGGTLGGSQTNVRTYTPLGGFLNLSGLPANSLAGPQYAMGRLIYTHKVGNGGQGILDVPAYLGGSIEVGNVWDTRSAASFESLHRDASVFFGADTPAGPAYLAVGYDDTGTVTAYLFLGRSF
jgi:NTE family protein